MKRTALALAAACIATLSGCGSDSVAMPNVQGADLAKAESQLEDLGLRVKVRDGSSEHRAVSAADDWVIASQSRTAGSKVDQDAAVELLVLRKGEKAGARPAASSGAPSGDDPAALAYLREQYADTSWLPLVTRVHTTIGALWADTELYPDSDALDPASAICTALSGYAIQRPEGFTGVSVRASTGFGLVNRTAVSDSCDAKLPN